MQDSAIYSSKRQKFFRIRSVINRSIVWQKQGKCVDYGGSNCFTTVCENIMFDEEDYGFQRDIITSHRHKLSSVRSFMESP